MTRRRVPPNIAWTSDEDPEGLRVFVAVLPTGPIAVLEGTAALVWREVATVREGPVVEQIAELTGHPVDLIRADVQGFLDDLAARGMLTADID